MLVPGGPASVGPIVLGADDQRDMLFIDRTDEVVRMDGKLVYQQAIDAMERSCRELLEGAELDIDVDLVIAHQANGRIINAVRERFGLDHERVADYIGALGNTSAASIPLALSLAREDGRLPDRGHVLLTAFGAGFSWGAALLTYGGDHPRLEGHRWRARSPSEERLGPVLGLVNDAGVRADGLAVTLGDDDWDRVLDTNLSAAFRTTRAVLRPMIKARYGRVVNVASVAGPRANPATSKTRS